ncbi:MAG: XrtA system polysaccharide chain length determinant [Pseudomonadota bacterium]
MQDLIRLLITEAHGAWRYRWWAIAVAWLVCLAGWPFVLNMPDVYEARAQVYVDADSRLADVIGEVGSAPQVGSQVFVVRRAMLGGPQLERVAREADLDLRAGSQKQQAELILGLRERIAVSEGGRTREARNLYTISYQDQDRDTAVRVVQILLDSFVEDVLELKDQGADDVKDYLQGQLNYYSDLLTQAEQRLADFKKLNIGLLPGDAGGIFERLQRELDAVRERENDLRVENDRRNELQRQIDARSTASIVAAQAGTDLMSTDTDTAIAELTQRRLGLLLSFTERHPDVIALDEQLEQLRATREQERRDFVSGGAGQSLATTDPVFQTVQISLNESNVRIAAMQSEINQRRATITSLQSQISTIPQIETEFAELNRDYGQYKQLYDDLLMQRERERLGSVGDEQDVVKFNIIEPPAAGFDPVAPMRRVLLAAVLLVGLGAGGALAFVLHQLNPVFHDARSLREITGRPVLGAVSMTWLERKRVERRVRLASLAAATGALFIAFILIVMFDVTLSQGIQQLAADA